MKKVIAKVATSMVAIICVANLFLGSMVQAVKKTKEDITKQTNQYDNPIYNNGTEDTYLFDTTDSVITNKTNLNRTKPQIIGKYEKSYYPSPSNVVSDKTKLANVLEESKEIMETVETDIANGTLKKHIAADGQYGATLSDDAKAVEKTIYINSNLKGGHSLAVYAPAGEVVTVTIPEEYLYLAEQGKMNIEVGLGYNADNISNRMPRLSKTFKITKNSMKVGNPFGGMLYLNLTTESPDELTIPVTVSGAVDTPYYDLGSTTKAQWEQSKNAPGLYAEIRTPYMRVLVPSTEVRNVADLYEALTFWTNVGALSTYAFGAQGRTLPITMIYDYYVFAGAAVATVGAWRCNFPVGWSSGIWNYETMMSSGNWGNLHEFNHHWQGTYGRYGRWGVGSVEEVTNNVMNAAEYILYTNIAAYRTEAGYSDWRKVADPYINLQQVLAEAKGTSPVSSVYMYTSLMHEFGVQNFLEVVKSNYSGGNYHAIDLPAYNEKDTRYDDFAYRTSVVMGKDLSYYFKEVLHFELTNETINKIKALKFEQYIPVQNLYTAGVKGVETGRPYYIPKGKFVFDFSKYMATPANFEIIAVGKPQYGTMTKNKDGTYTYQPNADIPEDTIDTYDLTVKLTTNGITQTRVLQGKIGFNYHMVTVEKYQIDKEDTDQAIALSKTTAPYATSYSSSMNYSTDSGYNLTKSQGYFTVPTSGEYEFQAYGDDKIRFNTNVNGKESISNTNTYTANVATAYQNKNCTHFTVSLVAGQAYPYTLYTNNRGGIGAGKVAYRKVGETVWQDISNTQLYANQEDVGKTTDRSFKQPDPPYYERGLRKITSQINVDYSKASVIQTPSKQPNDGNEASSIIDWNRSTFFHSKYSGGGITPFPHDYSIDLGEEKEFNKIEIYTRSGNSNGTIGDYKIYVSNDNKNWSEIASDEKRKGNNSAPITISKRIELTKARYVKVSALNNKGGNNFTIISSLELSIEADATNKIAQNSSKILYEGNWNRKTDGNYINGATYNSNNGTVKYGFDGSQTAIYSSKDAVIQVKIDQGEWQEYAIKGYKYNPSLILNQEVKAKHMVQIRVVSGELGLNLLGANGEFILYQEQKPEELTIYSENYHIAENEITKIPAQTSIDTFKKNIQTNAKNISFYHKDGTEVNTGKIGTGMSMKLNTGEKVFSLIVTGDTNGDSKVSVVDLVNIKKHIVGLATLQGAELKAGDTNADGKISVIDLVTIKKIIVGLIQ